MSCRPREYRIPAEKCRVYEVDRNALVFSVGSSHARFALLPGRNPEAILYGICSGSDAQCVAKLELVRRPLQRGAVGADHIGCSGLRHRNRSRARRRRIHALASTRSDRYEEDNAADGEKDCAHWYDSLRPSMMARVSDIRRVVSERFAYVGASDL